MNIACSQNKDINENQMIMDSTSASGLFVCKLTGPELQKRKAALQQEIFNQVKELKEVENGYIFHFTDEGDFIEKLVDYTLAEKKCCCSENSEADLDGQYSCRVMVIVARIFNLKTTRMTRVILVSSR